MSKYGPVDARVFVHSPNSWYQRIEINKGTDDGVHRGDPVINGAGLVGKVEDVTGGGAVVTLITDQSFATGVHRRRGPRAGQRHARRRRARRPAVRARRRQRQGARRRPRLHRRDDRQPAAQSRYPPAILIGTVTRIDLGNGDLDRRIHIKPAADMLRWTWCRC